MGVLSVVLRQFTVVYDGFLRDMVLTEGFLQKQIARIGVVAQYLGNHRLVPFPTEAGRNTFFRQPFGNSLIAVTGKVFGINAADKLGFHRNNFVPSVFQPVTQHGSIPRNSFLKVPLDAPLLVFACGAAFFLRIGRQNGQHQFAIGTHGVDTLFFKENVHLPGFEITDGLQQRDRISCKAGDGLGDHHIDFSGTAIGNKPLKVRPGILRAGLGFIGIDACIEPVAISLD